MLELTIQTSLLIYASMMLVGFVVVTHLLWMNIPYRKVITKLSVFYLLSFFGVGLVYYSDTLPIIIGEMISNIVLIIAMIIMISGIRELIGFKTDYTKYGGFVVIFTLLFAVFTYLYPSVNIRIYVYDVTVISLLFYALIPLMKWRHSLTHVSEIMVSIFIIMIITYLIRIIATLLINETYNSLLEYQSNGFYIALLGISNLLVIAGALSLIYTKTQLDLIESERSKSSLLSNLPGFAYRCKNDEHWTMLFVSDGFEALTGYSKEDIIKNKRVTYESIIHPDYRAYVRQNWEKAISNQERSVTEYEIVRKDGKRVWVWEQGASICNKDQREYIEGFIADINTRKKAEKDLAYLSYHDPLTGLYNRRFIETELKRLAHSRHLPISIIMADINNLKFVNDAFGHNQGDKLIKITAQKMKQSIRGHELIARTGGDEFIIVLEKTSLENAKIIIDRIKTNLKQDNDMHPSVALGYACQTKPEESLDQIRIKAENKMYESKRKNKPKIENQSINFVMGVLFEKKPMEESHAKNVKQYAKQLAMASGLPDDEIELAEMAGYLHDIGKVVLEDLDLDSEKLFQSEDLKKIQKHPLDGHRILSCLTEYKKISNIVLYHHEHIDGGGYPHHLKKDKIPYLSRVLAICEVYDVLTNPDSYRPTLSKKEALDVLKKDADKQFDKELVEIFASIV
ncbi:MAG: diguanylate cyclase [Candidatus Izimaplasma sp.]|nr:diguanylate cyclase [Candidatus Izimaplasma bacterium]